VGVAVSGKGVTDEVVGGAGAGAATPVSSSDGAAPIKARMVAAADGGGAEGVSAPSRSGVAGGASETSGMRGGAKDIGGGSGVDGRTPLGEPGGEDGGEAGGEPKSRELPGGDGGSDDGGDDGGLCSGEPEPRQLPGGEGGGLGCQSLRLSSRPPAEKM
jgi:hypothetical protein